MRSARAAVSSGSDANDTLNGTRPNASTKPEAGGSVKAGFDPCTITTSTLPPAMAPIAVSISP